MPVLTSKILKISPRPIQTELHNYIGLDKGRSLGMPLDKFCNEAYNGLASSTDQVVIGSIGPRDEFMDIADKRRSTFEILANMIRSP